MNVREFREILTEFQEGETALLDSKRVEYASADGDVLENFKTLARLLHVTPSQVATVLLAKHVQGIAKQVMDRTFSWDWSQTTPDGQTEGLKQRVADARNYLVLLAACIKEEGAP